MSGMSEERSFQHNQATMVENHRVHGNKDAVPGSQLWTDGLICAFEFIQVKKRSATSKSASIMKASSVKNQLLSDGGTEPTNPLRMSRSNLLETDLPHPAEKCEGSCWVPIGWARISELVLTVQADAEWATQHFEFNDSEDETTVADVAAPYWERPVGPTWWCHLSADHRYAQAWLNAAQWLHPAIRTALREEKRLISDRMKHLLYEVPVRVAGGLLFELLGQSVGEPYDEDDIPVVLRSWQAQHYLVTVLHVKGSASRINVLGITEVQEQLLGGDCNAPKTAHEIIAALACRLARWDDRLFRKYIFGAADEVELKFVNRRSHDYLNLLGVILNQEIKKLSSQVIRVKWSLHAIEEIVFELLHHLKGNTTNNLLEGTRKSTREMIEEQEAVRGRLFTIQDVMQSTVRSWLQDKSLAVTHNLAVFGGCGLVLSFITGLFGINLDGIPGSESSPYAFGLFVGILSLLGLVLIVVGLVYLGLRKPIGEEDVEVMNMKSELDDLVMDFQEEVETHAHVQSHVSRRKLPVGDKSEEYLFIT